jgi:phosphoglycerate dehydrogenase-like enzyme
MDTLKAIAPEARLVYCEEPEDFEPLIADAEIVAGHVTPAALANAKRLRWVHSWAAGPDPQLFPEMVASPVVLTCSKGNGAIPLAEHAMMLMLMLQRDARRMLAAQAEKRWDRFMHPELNGLTCGIIGTGFSGVDLAQKAKAFHMQVLGLRRHPAPTPFFDHVYARDELRVFLAACDVLVMTAPLTPETRGMLGEAEFRAMKPGAFYICYSRGGIADDAALIKALQEGWIAGAGLDAHLIEPLPEESPFWNMPNVIVTAHHGAVTPQTRERGFRIFADNLVRYRAGEPLTNVVDKQGGY